MNCKRFRGTGKDEFILKFLKFIKKIELHSLLETSVDLIFFISDMSASRHFQII